MTRWVTEATPVSSAERRAIGPVSAPVAEAVVVPVSQQDLVAVRLVLVVIMVVMVD